MGFLTAVRDNAAYLLAALSVALGFITAVLLRRIESLQDRLGQAIQAAEDAARAAALAAPGGIDPEAVIALLRSGQPTSLDAIYQAMEQQALQQAAQTREY